MSTELLYLKNEIVAKRGLFLAKKRYSLYSIENEGRKVDEIINMGVETKRSDFGNFTKESLSELLEILLKSSKFSMSQILKFVNEKKKDFMKRILDGDKSIARPVSYVKNLSEYKVVSQGVHALLNFNLLEYEVFGVGDKGHMFKVKGIDLLKCPPKVKENYEREFLSKGKKLEVIAIPDEMKKLPDYFIVDQSELLKFSWIDRYSLLLEPLISIQKNEGVLTF